MEEKAQYNDYLGRFREIVADPNNLRIPRVERAGFIDADPDSGERHVIMHNGLKVLMGEHGYYGAFSSILAINRGVHEPQEEYAFGLVLDEMAARHGAAGRPVPPMMELGAYWAFYSMWFKRRNPDSRAYMVEPDVECLEAGRRNFALNGLDGEFIRHKVGEGGFSVADFMDGRGIETLGILHVDIQGAETQLLPQIEGLLQDKRFEYLVWSTHDQEKHAACRDCFRDFGYAIVTEVDFERESFSYDGLVVAAREADWISPIPLYSRDAGDRPERVVSMSAALS